MEAATDGARRSTSLRRCDRAGSWPATKNKDLDDDALRVIAETRQYLDDADELLTRNSAPGDFFKAMLKRYPNRRLGATTLWAGTRSLLRPARWPWRGGFHGGLALIRADRPHDRS